MPAPGSHTVLVADFLDESSVESPVLDDIATLVLCRATREEELACHLPGADAIMLFHDIPHLGEASFARAPRCKCVVRAGVGYNNVDLAAASRHGVVVCNVPDYGPEEVADHAIMFLLALVRRLMPCHQRLARMRAGAILINTARGPCLDESALLDALDSGRLAATGLDVVEREPLDDPRLRDHPRILFTPHSAFYGVEGFIELRTKTAEEVRRILLGEPPRNPVNLGTPPHRELV